VRPGEQHRLSSAATLELEDGTTVDAPSELPSDLPLGAHLLHPADGGPTTTLFVVPARSPRPDRGWGWSAQLYATTSEQSWGHGDLGDLARLASWTRDAGGSILAHNPLGAPLPTEHQQPSPYYASTRRFWSPLYLRVESVLGADRVGADVERAATAGRALNAGALIDRDRVWALKRDALERIWADIADTATVRQELDRARSDPELTRFATFCTLAEHHGDGWTNWPAQHQHPDDPAVGAFAARHADRVDFHRWLQIEADTQLATAAASGAGLMADLPVGFDPSGFDAWTDQDLLASGCSVGAPPDDFSPTGQDWGLPPYVPWRLRSVAYRPWLDTLRRVLRHSAALRVDHVMGLFRLFWIPSDAAAGTGGYVYHRGTELLDLAVMEATRAGATLVGEDLGTVEDEVRRALAERDVFGYRIGWFAEDPPEAWPATTLASLTTHDLPTAAGLWSGQDARDRAAAGLAPDEDGESLLRTRLARLAGVEDLSAPPRDGAQPSDERSVVVAAHRALARSGSDLAVATLEDAVGVRSRTNLPGTIDQHPNWRQMLPVGIEDLDAAGAAEVAEVMGAGRQH
jgi:4-alpha-glucanotransferase